MQKLAPFLPKSDALIDCGDGKRIHRRMLADFRALQDRARRSGFELQPVSAYRSIEDQLIIWNAKATGKRKIYSDTQEVISPDGLDAEQVMFAILRYSALPGASRHHWGSDIDVIDGAAVKDGYQVQLSVDETREGRVFGAMHNWLDKVLAEAETKFFRPYGPSAVGARCVAEEPWHLSYLPLAQSCERLLTVAELERIIRTLDIELKECVLDNLQCIYEQYCCPTP